MQILYVTIDFDGSQKDTREYFLNDEKPVALEAQRDLRFYETNSLKCHVQ